MSLLITLCARGGSKGIPGKNIRLLNEKPLIAYSIDVALRFATEHNGTVALSTDDEEIMRVANDFGLTTDYKRPAYLATDTTGKIDVISDLLNYTEKKVGTLFNFILDLDITSPLRTYQDLEHAFGIILPDEQAYNLFSVNNANRNPYFNMVEQKENGYFGLVKKGDFTTRQSAPGVYDMNASFYFYRRCFFSDSQKSAITDRSLIYIMPHICFDLDHQIDFDFMEFLLLNKKLNFEL